MLNSDMSAVSFAKTPWKPILEDCGECEGLQWWDGGQIWSSEWSTSLTNRGRCSKDYETWFQLIWHVSLSRLCLCITHVGSSDPPRQQITRSAYTDADFSPFHRSVDPRSTQTFTPRMRFRFESCRDITILEFALDLPACTCFNTNISIFHTEFLTCESKVRHRRQPERKGLIITRRHLALWLLWYGCKSVNLRGRTQKKSKYPICLLHSTELPPEVFFSPEANKLKQTHEANVSSLWLLPAVGSDAAV